MGLAGIGGVGSTCKDSVAIRLANLLTCGIGCRLLYGYHIRRELLRSGFRNVADNAVWRADNSFTAGRTFNNQVVGVFIRIAVPQGIDNQFTVVAGVVAVHGNVFVVASCRCCRCSKGNGTGIVQGCYSRVTVVVPSGIVQADIGSAGCNSHCAVQYCAVFSFQCVDTGNGIEHIVGTADCAAIHCNIVGAAISQQRSAIGFHSRTVQCGSTIIKSTYGNAVATVQLQAACIFHRTAVLCGIADYAGCIGCRIQFGHQFGFVVRRAAGNYLVVQAMVFTVCGTNSRTSSRIGDIGSTFQAGRCTTGYQGNTRTVASQVVSAVIYIDGRSFT